MKIHVGNIGQIVTMKGVLDKDGIGITKDDLSVVEGGELFFDSGVIRFVGPEGMIGGNKPDVIVDAKGGVVMPAFVDPHTHAVFAGSRFEEFEMRSEGKSYQEIAEQGGGIAASTKSLHEASVEDLAEQTAKRLFRMSEFGVGVVEIKSGYGLTLETELRMLEAVAKLSELSPVTTVSTFLGAHAIPGSYKNEPEAYVKSLIERMLPEVAGKKLAKFCDVFAETGYFTIDQARRILLAAKKLGFSLKIHADEFEPLGGAQLAAEVGATSADHLLAVDDDGIKALAKASVTAVCLPGTSLYLGEGRYAPARKMIDAGVRVALGSDLNPGSCYTENFGLILTLACTQLKMTVAETLAAATYNAAKAVGLESVYGALLPGRVASFAIYDVPHYAGIPYHMGVSELSGLWLNGKWVMGDPGIKCADHLEQVETPKECDCGCDCEGHEKSEEIDG